ncbi:MAG: FAD-dependent oxidoreductase [Rhodospirillales bacterium]|nr:FAD-dependent oxidoreductase [Rhodospirillales bacterium]
MLKVAIVGSGPSGCYVAERLARARKSAIDVDVFERLPTPFGLVRGGVAPDHQRTKAVERVLLRALAQPEVRFLGNVAVGWDLPLDALRTAYDAVVLAVGAPIDCRLGIPGETLDGVLGSAAFVGWYNGHPDHADLEFEFDRLRSAVVIGNGNVAIDVARVLSRVGSEMALSDLDPVVEAAMVKAPLERIMIAGRRGPADVKFSPVELGELGQLARGHPVVRAQDLSEALNAANPALGVLSVFAGMPVDDRPVAIEFAFHVRPEEFIADADGRLGAVRFRRTHAVGSHLTDTDESFEIPAQLAVTCIGYRCEPLDGLQPAQDSFANVGGRIDDGLYVIGWAGRGPSGTIATNRSEGHALADRILADVAAKNRPGWKALLPYLKAADVVSLDDWRRIDAAESERAPKGRVRRKFRNVKEMLAIARTSP